MPCVRRSPITRRRSAGGVVHAPEGGVGRDDLHRLGYQVALADEVARDRVPQTLVRDPVRAVGAPGQVTAGDLVRPLGAGFD